MTGWWAAGLLSSLVGGLPTNVEWQYSGTLQRSTAPADAAITPKQFTLVVVAQKGDGTDELAYLTEDRGEGAWALACPLLGG